MSGLPMTTVPTFSGSRMMRASSTLTLIESARAGAAEAPRVSTSTAASRRRRQGSATNLARDTADIAFSDTLHAREQQAVGRRPCLQRFDCKEVNEKQRLPPSLRSAHCL